MMRFKYQRAEKPKELSVSEGVGTSSNDLQSIAKAVPCQEACPAKTDVPAYIEQISKGQYDEAYKINQKCNVFPGVLGRICTRVCEDQCRHNWTNIHGPVQICHLKRYAADEIEQKQDALKPYFGPSGKTIAVVGGGPAGLSAARELARYGHKVSVYERGKQLGGMLVDGIPAFRLPRDIVKAEIALIEKNGIDVHLNKQMGQVEIKTLVDQFDAVLVTCGTTKTNAVRIKGVDASVETGLDFMEKFNNGAAETPNGDVVIIGGGFSAIDCARSVRRLAPKSKVTIVYRRTEAFMAADKNEFKAMKEENIAIRTLLSPLALEKDADGNGVLITQKNRVMPAKAGEKPAIHPIEGSLVKLRCDKVILAIGQNPDLSILPEDAVSTEGVFTSVKNLFLAGDYRTGSSDVISAVADGKLAAEKVDTFLSGKQRLIDSVTITPTDCDGETGRLHDHTLQSALPMPTSSVEDRFSKLAEVETGFTDKIAQVAATRCYLCNYKFEIDPDKCIHCNWCIQAAPRKCIKKVSRFITDESGFPKRYIEAELAKETTFIYIDNDECIRCGKCLRVCPTEAISLKKLKLGKCSKGSC